MTSRVTSSFPAEYSLVAMFDSASFQNSRIRGQLLRQSEREQRVISSSDRRMQGGDGDVKTMPAPRYIPLGDPTKVLLCNGGAPPGLAHRNPYRAHRQTSQGSNYYSKTKRKRDSSSCSGRSESPKNGETVSPPPPWHNPTYPYTRGIIG